MEPDVEDFLLNQGKAISASGFLPKRDFKPGTQVSIIGAGALMLAGMNASAVDRLVDESLELGVDYFDCAPTYGNGDAEEKLGHALRGRRDCIFLTCKTLERTAAGAQADLEGSLRRLGTDRIDLYQFHAVNRVDDMNRILGPGGAMETFRRARDRGWIRWIGFSSHSVPIALALMERFPFDSILFPVNYVCWARGNFGPQVLDKARSLGIARIAVKSLACRPWRSGEERKYPNCWYRPIDEPETVFQAMRFTLAQDVCALFPPADARLYRMALSLAQKLTPLSPEECKTLFESARSLKPILAAPRERKPPAGSADI
jgi:predicted aldo/keto reductase-like oxidoreductase